MSSGLRRSARKSMNGHGAPGFALREGGCKIPGRGASRGRTEGVDRASVMRVAMGGATPIEDGRRKIYEMKGLTSIRING